MCIYLHNIFYSFVNEQTLRSGKLCKNHMRSQLQILVLYQEAHFVFSGEKCINIYDTICELFICQNTVLEINTVREVNA